MTEVQSAEALIRRNMPVWSAERLSLDLCAERVLAEDVLAERDLPAFDRVTMDGIAVRFAEYSRGRREFEIVGTQAAGRPAMSLGNDNHCLRIMTGAVLPPGADTVIPIERLDISDGVARIEAEARVERSQFVHSRGSDRRRGIVLLRAGTRLGPPEMAVLASNGNARVEVRRVPKIAVVSTGDELVGVADPIEPFQIRSSNGRAVEAALCRHRVATVSRVRLRDDESALLSRIEALHVESDALILSGGVSMGDYDFVPTVLERLGAELVFHRIEQKPGRPMWFGLSKAGKPIFALPGNPVSTLVCVARYVVPALLRAMGLADERIERVRLAAAPGEGPSKMTWFVPVRIECTEDGRTLAHPRQINTSGDFSSLAGTDGIVELSTRPADRSVGGTVPLYRW
jgi:molybdopterin molybdotransferase